MTTQTQWDVFLTSDPTELPEKNSSDPVEVPNAQEPYWYPSGDPDMSYRATEQIFGTRSYDRLPFKTTAVAQAAATSKFFSETLMVGDRLRFSYNKDADLTRTPHYYTHVARIVKNEGGVVTDLVFVEGNSAGVIDSTAWDDITFTILSQRAFNSAHHNQLECELPFPMKIKSIELCTYSLQNVSTVPDAGRPGVEDGSGNQDCHDYYSVHIDPFSSPPTVSNHPRLNGMFAIIPADAQTSRDQLAYNGKTSKGAPINIFTSNVGVVQSMNLGYNVKTVRLTVRDRRGQPLKCHRAHFWLKVNTQELTLGTHALSNGQHPPYKVGVHPTQAAIMP